MGHPSNGTSGCHSRAGQWGCPQDVEPEKDYGKTLNRYEVSHRGEKVAILGLGSFYQLGEAVAARLKEEKGVDATLVNPRYITGVDEALLDDLKRDHTLVITLEDGVLDGWLWREDCPLLRSVGYEGTELWCEERVYRPLRCGGAVEEEPVDGSADCGRYL